MPTAAPKPCVTCRALVLDGSSRCMAHKVAPGSFADKRRGTRHQRGYGTAWDKRRLGILARDGGLCQVCLKAGIVTPNCRTVDHIVAKAEGGTDDPSNLQTICTPCHATKTRAEAARARGEASGTDEPAGGGEKSSAPWPRTDRFVKLSRAGVSGRGGIT